MKNNNLKNNPNPKISRWILCCIFIEYQNLSHFSMGRSSRCSIALQVWQNSPCQQREMHDLYTSCCISTGVPPFLSGGNRGSLLLLTRKGNTPFCYSQQVTGQGSQQLPHQGKKGRAIKKQQHRSNVTFYMPL